MLKNNGDIPSENLKFSCNNEGCTLTTELEGYELTNLNKIDFKGTKLSSGTVIISDSGRTIIAKDLKINGFTCNYNNEVATCELTGNNNQTTVVTEEDNVYDDNIQEQPEINTTTTVQKETLENKIYQIGDAVILADYNWHVINDDGTNVTLLMDTGIIDNMRHCTSDKDELSDCGVNSDGTYYVYSWDKSLIRTYLKDTLYPEISGKISNEIILTEICADPAVKSGKTYGGYLVSEISSISGASCITTVNDYIRLISPNEYTTLKTKVSDTSWLYTAGSWFTMGAYSGIMASHVQSVYVITYDGTLGNHFSSMSYIVRPVITIKKS